MKTEIFLFGTSVFILSIFGGVVMHYVMNISKTVRRRFWMFLFLMLLARQVIFLVVEVGFLNVQIANYLHSILSVSMAGYFIWYISKEYGEKVIDNKEGGGDV